MKYTLHPEAAQDLRDAAEFYKERVGLLLSQSLFDEFERVLNLLMRHPMIGAVGLYGKRRFIMKHFPYSLVYTIVGEEIRVLAVAHHHRRPGYWNKRK